MKIFINLKNRTLPSNYTNKPLFIKQISEGYINEYKFVNRQNKDKHYWKYHVVDLDKANYHKSYLTRELVAP